MSYTTRHKAQEQHSSNQAPSKTFAQFADNRATTAAQLKQQALIASGQAVPVQLMLMTGSLLQQQKTIQRAEDEESLQGKFEPVQKAEKTNDTGLPDNLKSGIESLSGMSMDHVKVHYNSDKPAQLNAHAYAQGSDIHVAPRQEQHLPHEAWHVVQQAQGRVNPTTQMKGTSLNDDVGLETEADVMGTKAASLQLKANNNVKILGVRKLNVAQRYTPVIQRVDATELIQDACGKLWELIKAAHTTNAAALILNGLSVLALAVRYARSDNSIGAQIGSGLVGLLLAIDSAVTAAEEWKNADGEGKDIWKKRVDAIEKVTTTLVMAASIFALPFNPVVGGAIGAIGVAAIKTLRSGYDVLAKNVLFKSESDQPNEQSTLV
jgi:hypothetical protein